MHFSDSFAVENGHVGMVRKYLRLIWIGSLVVLLLYNCTKDIVPEPVKCDLVVTFADGVQEVLRKKCNSSGCHDGSSGVGNYNSFKNMEGVIDNGLFRQEVFVRRTMPKEGDLTPEEFELLRCWSDNGFPEN